jgi:hypothetical protein
MDHEIQFFHSCVATQLAMDFASLVLRNKYNLKEY